MTPIIDNTQDIMDSRDIIERIDELKQEIEGIEEADEKFAPSMIGDPDDPVDENLRDELAKLQAFADEAEGYSEDWIDGATLIRDSYFVEAMQDLCQGIGDLPKDIPSYLVIDWDATAENLKADYSTAEFDGTTYYVR